MNNIEKAKIVKDTAEKLNLSDKSKSVAVMGALIGANPVNLLMGLSNSEQTQKAESQPILTQTINYNHIQRIIADMLTESTGVNMLDSGGSMGRHFQMNRMIRDFRKNKPLVISLRVFNDGDLDLYFSTNIFHYLTNCLAHDSLCEELEEEFKEFCELEDNKRTGYYYLMEEFTKLLKDRYEGKSFGYNTYNGESNLSQVLQYNMITESYLDEPLILLQIHNGCDVRGGYTKPRIFKLDNYYEWLPNDQDINANCDCAEYYTDDSYHWYKNNNEHDSEIYNNGLPKKWRVVNLNQHGDDLGYDDKMFKCNQCNKIVLFSSYCV